jgi:anti-sigma regulatory factor (Ser/Thr protein kinase)
VRDQEGYGSLSSDMEDDSAVDHDLVSLPADGRAAGMARSVVRSRLREWKLDELLDSAVLLTSEIVTNVIVHTASAPELELSRAGAGLLVSVVDGSPVPPRRRLHSATATTGRGLEMLQDLANDWGWTPVRDGKAVWFLLVGDGINPRSKPPSPPRPSSNAASAFPESSPLGRYAPSADAGDLITVELLGVPVRVLAASREHHDGLMREFRIMALSDSPDHGLPARLVELTQTLGRGFSAARSRPDEDFEQAVLRGLDRVDLVYQVPPAAGDGAARLEELMNEADEFCRSPYLITLARTPVMIRFGRWYLAQFREQIAGRPATRWDGPLDP